MRPIEDFCCQNPECALFGCKNSGNLYHRGWSGASRKIRLLCCRACNARFSERKGTPLFASRMPEEKALDVIRHLADHNGIRQTSRLTGTNKDAVNRLARLVGKHAEKVHDELVAFSPEHPGGSTRREVVVRRQKRKTLRSGKPR